MSDAAFELLATAILREAQAEYAALVHPGVNSEGKTVKAPVDGIGFVAGANPRHMIAVHHTTFNRDRLRKKWLHDPAAVKPRKGKNPTMPAGDLIKTAEIVAAEKGRDPEIRATLVLTSNQEPPEDLVRDTHAAGQSRGFDVDIWSASRLAHFLDNTATGQWLRRKRLGIEQERLSQELLQELSRESLKIHLPSNDKAAWVSTILDAGIAEAVREQDVAFVVAESGLGKSVACYKRLDQHIGAGGFGLILTHQVISSSLTIEQAIESTLRQLHPALTAGAALDALAFCSSDRPLMLVVEDINKSGEAQFLAEKLAKWSSFGQADPATNSPSRASMRECWRLLCPVWPQVIASLSDANLKLVQSLAVIGAPFTMREGGEAVLRRAESKGAFLSSLEAEAISEALGSDPLLIALHDHEPGLRPQPESVIERFIDASVRRLAFERSEYTAGEYRCTLRLLAGKMLQHRELSPSWQDVLDWFPSESSATTMLRHLVRHGEVIRLSGTPGDEFLSFRHDRVRDALFADSIAVMIRDDSLSNELLTEPYFAEVVGAALLHYNIPLAFVGRVQASNPLALFHALRLFREPISEVHRAILAAIDFWLADENTQKPQNTNLHWEALAALSRTESSKVVEIVRRFKEQGWTAWEALFRNGEISGGLLLCFSVEPGTGAPWRDRQVEHAKVRFGSRYRTAIGQLLRKTDLNNGFRVGALRLAGYFADPQLAESIEASWNLDAEKDAHLGDYLWAAAQCCGSDPQHFLGPVCDAWAALPTERDGTKPSPRDDLAANHIKWAFRKDVPVSAIGYFIDRAKTKDELRWPITYMLNGLDHPDAVEFVVRELADTDRRLEGTGGFSPFSISATDDWSRDQDEGGRKMSRESRDRLLALWQNLETDKHKRHQAFRFWAATKTDEDLGILRSVDASDMLADSVLRQRLERRDREAIPALLLKLNGGARDRKYWWQFAHYVWSDELTQALEEELALRSTSVDRTWNASFSTDEQIYRLIMNLPTTQAETLLVRHWDHLQFRSVFVQAALYVATPRLLQNVEQVIKSSPDPKAMFQYLDQHYGIRRKGWRGVTHRSQLEVLTPYLDYLDELTIYVFWELCNERGWFDLRHRLFDDRVERGNSRLYLDEDRIKASLDEMLTNPRNQWTSFWVESYLKTGATPEEVIVTVQKWLAAQSSLKALEIAAKIVVQVGQRKDVHILELPIEPKSAVDALVADVTFAVRRRRLYDSC
jgi:hypothetical protein